MGQQMIREENAEEETVCISSNGPCAGRTYRKGEIVFVVLKNKQRDRELMASFFAFILSFLAFFYEMPSQGVSRQEEIEKE